MMELLVSSLKLLVLGKLFREPGRIYGRLALANVVCAVCVVGISVAKAKSWLVVLPAMALGLLIPYLLRNVKYR